ncbi:hypothetical protein [Polaribacter tangerinus]|uniref:hypothetical protein n=1 Tax=Polaribacter tangerinus TaxID=1920034 RepID=UPI001303EF89|nr:hypothetical protein [Polaribacter tangerinus]
MSNSFKDMLPKQKASTKVKRNVLLDVKFIKYTIEVSEYYLLKYPKTITHFFNKK